MDKKTTILTIVLIFIAFYSIGYGFYKYVVSDDVEYYTESSDAASK